MPKLFRIIFISLSACALCSGAFATTNDSLCLPPKPIKTTATDASTAPHPDAQTYHQAMQTVVEQAKTTLDWIEDPKADNNCGGYYQTPENPNPQAEIPPEDADLIISATEASQDEQGYTSMSGSVEVYQGLRRFRCDSMRFSREQQFTELSGNIQLREPGLLLLADTATLDGINQQSSFTGTEYVLHAQQAHGKAGYISLSGGDSKFLTLKETSFTLCPPSAEYWQFNAKHIEMDDEKGWGKLYSAVFKLGKVPVFYLPYLDFPIDDRRKTGLLWPSISSADHGIDLTLPYYFNIAPQFDMTYIPRYNADHGILNGLEARYKHRYSEWAFGGTYINNDDRVGEIEAEEDNSLDRKRWLAFIQESGRFNANWATEIDYQAVSDINYYRDWGVTGLDVKKATNIKREAVIRYSDKHWKASSTLIDYQTLEFDRTTNEVAEEEYRQLPSLNLLFRDKQRNFHFEPVFYAQYTFFNHDERIEGQRAYAEPGFTFPMRFRAGEIIPTFKYKYKHLRLDSSNEPEQVTQINTEFQGSHDTEVASFSLDNRLFLERSLEIADNQFLQTLTPRLFFYYADYEDQSTQPEFDTAETAFSYQQLFRDNRFGSYDRIADANQLTVAIETALINKHNGSKLFTFGIGQIRYFSDRKVAILASDRELLTIDGTETAEELSQKEAINRVIDRKYYRHGSDIALQANWYIDDKQQIGSSLIWDPYYSQNSETTLAYHYRGEQNHLFNIGYRYKRLPPSITAEGELFDNDIDQADLSFYQPINRNWHTFLRWNFDINKKETIEDIIGLKYEGCCWGVMLAYQRERKTFENNLRIEDTADVDYRYNWFIQFELKGLGGVTNSITRLIEESIQGFKERETTY